MDNFQVRLLVVIAILTTAFISVAIVEYIRNTSNILTPSISVPLGSVTIKIFLWNTNQTASMSVHNPVNMTLKIGFSVLTNPEELAQYVRVSSFPSNVTYDIAPFQSGSVPFVFSVNNKTVVNAVSLDIFAMGTPA